jgi:hypothetical protein
MNKLLSLILNVFKDINTHKKDQISKDLDVNTEVAIKVNGMLTDKLNQSVPLLNRISYNQVVAQSQGHQRIEDHLQSSINNIDWDDPESEITEVELIEQKVANRNTINRKIGNILTERGFEADQKTGLMKNASAWLLGRNKSLTKQYVECVKNDLELEKELNKRTESSSLLDDFADPSLEQPSHMDPED